MGIYISDEDVSYFATHFGKPYHNEARTNRHRNWIDLSPVSCNQKWMNYPTLTLDVKETYLVVLGDEFGVNDLVTSVSSIYDEDIESKVQLETNLGTRPGIYDAVVSVVDSRGNKVSTISTITVVDGEGVFLPTNTAVRNTGYVDNQSVSLYKDGLEVQFKYRYSSNESKEITFHISDKDYRYFEAYVGIEKHVRDNTAYGSYGKVQFEVYVDDVLAYQSKVIA